MTTRDHTFANELERALIGDSAAAPPSHILESISDDLAHKKIPGTPHTIYAELWHITFWQQITLEWISNIETPCPASADLGFPSQEDITRESWPQLCQRFFKGVQLAGAAAADTARLDIPVRCPSPAGQPTRTMTVREQLESLAAHNAYHFGRIVLLRQLNHAWPPASGGFTW
ncbi:MAG: DinB family protein [Silvibacterium sp.]